ncbi:hypothetical protein NHF50_13055 [Flavobacterium sp. NRK F10]|uniref:hypothetical protein n=1 Tax=Flavobacterium sp. NRK F10 TaxID=2954931 RepID=UPI0020918CBC|nr:hypothetical protein [Flavobacterium sp. NRK F10]MCO6175974.1 hypothetical protein [Flavobacterium sp. NRK F10]
MEEYKQELHSIDTSGKVALPFNEEQFKDFIVSLLGKPQTISKYLRGSFEINKENIISLFEVINQRIYQQNDSKLIQFRASIYYNDNTTVTLNGFDHLVHYNEKLPLVSRAVHLTWQYLVKFRDKETFEKQEISISFVTDNNGPIPSFDDDIHHRYYDSGVSFRISHTARTWGADIEAMLTKNLQTLIKKDNKIIDFFKFNSERVGHLISAALIAITLILSLINTNEKIKLNENINNSTLWIHHYGNYIFLFLGIYFLQKITLIVLEEFEFYGAPSFIILTPESEKNKIKVQNSYKRKLSKYLLTVIGSLILGVAGNYLYTYLTTK